MQALIEAKDPLDGDHLKVPVNLTIKTPDSLVVKPGSIGWNELAVRLHSRCKDDLGSIAHPHYPSMTTQLHKLKIMQILSRLYLCMTASL